MAKTLKEALLEKFADLQQLGIAPTTAPIDDDDRPAVVVEMGPDSYGESGGRRQRGGRGGMYDDDRRGGDMPFRARASRGGPPAGRGRGGERAALEGMAPMPGAMPRPPFGDRGPRPPMGDRPAGPRPPFGDRPAGPRPPFGDRPAGPRPPFGDRGPRPSGPGGPGGDRGPRPAGPGGPGGPGIGPDLRAQQAAERRRREAGQRDELMALIGTHSGGEVTPEIFDKFLADLTVETGALPEIGRILDAVKLANSIEAAKVGNAVRQLFRRPRPRPAGAPPARPAAPAPAQAAAPAPAPEPAPVAAAASGEGTSS